MRKIVVFMLAMLCVVFTVPAFAENKSTDTISLEGLSAEQAKSIRAEVEKAQRKAAPELTLMDKAVELSRIVGAGLVATAKELGIAANEFAKSDLGRVMMFILVWKYLGHDFLGILIGIPFMISGVLLGLHLVRKSSLESVHIEYTYIPKLFGLITLKRVVKYDLVKRSHLKDSEKAQQTIGYCIIFFAALVGMITIF